MLYLFYGIISDIPGYLFVGSTLIFPGVHRGGHDRRPKKVALRLGWFMHFRQRYVCRGTLSLAVEPP